MTRALVVYESMFGNTRTIAEAIADGLAAHATVDLVEVGDASPVVADDVDLVVVGGPTHAFGMSRPSTRDSARQQATAPLVSTRRGIREWVDDLDAPAGTAVATFATRVPTRFLPGSAAAAAARRLRRHGVDLVARPADFWVEGTPGPLRAGEVERARAWGASLGADLASRSATTG